jgi:hypothetical protein
MELMGVIAVVVNLALLGIGGSLTRMFPGMTSAQRILLIIVIEVCFTGLLTRTLNLHHDFSVLVPPWSGIFFKLVRCGYTLGVTLQASYSPEYITPTQKNHDYY